MSHAQLTQCHQRLQRKLAACYGGWHSGRIDRLEEALRAIEREMHRAGRVSPPATGAPATLATRGAVTFWRSLRPAADAASERVNFVSAPSGT